MDIKQVLLRFLKETRSNSLITKEMSYGRFLRRNGNFNLTFIYDNLGLKLYSDRYYYCLKYQCLFLIFYYTIVKNSEGHSDLIDEILSKINLFLFFDYFKRCSDSLLPKEYNYGCMGSYFYQTLKRVYFGLEEENQEERFFS